MTRSAVVNYCTLPRIAEGATGAGEGLTTDVGVLEFDGRFCYG